MPRACSFCPKAAKYMCPHCNSSYCNSVCFKCERHKECYEKFCQQWVISELKTIAADDEMKKKTLEMLRRINLTCNENEDLDQSQESADDDSFTDLIDLSVLDPEELLMMLSEDDRHELDRVVESEAIFDMLPDEFWIPWYRLERNLVSEVDQNSESDVSKDSADIPAFPCSVPKLQSLVSKVSPLLAYSVVNIVFSYCYIVHYFNGEHCSMVDESFTNLLDVSPVFKENVLPRSTQESLQLTVEPLLNTKHFPLVFVKNLLEDTRFVLNKGNQVILRLLNDLFKLTKNYKQLHKQKSKEIRQIEKRILFYQSYSNENAHVLKNEIPSVNVEILRIEELEKMKMNIEVVDKLRQTVHNKSKRLIEQI